MEKRERAFWVGVVADYERGGQTHQEVANRHGVRLGTLQSWLYRLRRECESKKVRMLPVKVTSAPPTPAAPPGMMELTSACAVLRFEMGADPAYVARLVDALERARC